VRLRGIVLGTAVEAVVAKKSLDGTNPEKACCTFAAKQGSGCIITDSMPIRFKKYLSALYKNTWLLFACTAGTVGVAFATPPMLGLDEAAHFNRVYQISEGGVRSTISPSGRDLGGPVPAAVVRLQEESIIIRKRQSNKTWPDYTRAAYNTSMKGEKTVASFPGAATYSPFAYGTGTLGMLLARVLNLSFGATVLLVRLTMLAGCVAAVAYAIFLLRNYKIKWLVFVLALWPQSIFQASVITADSAATALCFLLFAFYFKAFSQGSKKPLSHKNMLLMALCAVILPLVKVNYLPVSLVAAFVPLPIIARKVRGVQMPAYVYRLVFGGFVVMLAVAWLYVTKDYTNLIYPDRGVLQAGLEPGTKGQLLYVLGNPLRLVRVLASTVVHSGLSESWDHGCAITACACRRLDWCWPGVWRWWPWLTLEKSCCRSKSIPSSPDCWACS